jgi:N-acetylglucosaminyldiphosphoundecaprenol N-acetyl-beta-D-mannosaminyltransferase
MSRVQLFGVEIDACTMQEAVSRILDSGTDHFGCEFVVTPNLDHAVLLEKNEGLRAAYEHARLVLADGWPVILASRLLGRPLPERVTGSDLVPAVFDACQKCARSLTVYLLGAGPGVAERAATKIQERWPLVSVVGTYSPPLGFERDPKECSAIIERINAASPELLVLGLGAPKQELWIDKHYQDLSARWALCVGACIDFLAGEKRRAPRWMQVLCLEWLFRLGSEPKRLFKRYLHDGLAFPRLLLKEFFTPTSPAKPEKAQSGVRNSRVENQ